MPKVTLTEWKAFLAGKPQAHLLQTAEWGELKAAFGWEAAWVVAGNAGAGNAGAQVLFRRLPLGLTIAYIPKSPMGEDWGALWPEVEALCRSRGAVFLKVEPDEWQAGDDKPPEGFRASLHDIQPPRTILVDIGGEEEDDILARMKQKTRYNIRLAARKEVVVRPWDDLESFAEIMQVTGERSAFGVHSLAYYRKAYELFHPQGAVELFVAEYEGEPLAALMVFARGARAWYLYGASNERHRNRMPSYLLQWEAIRWARSKGCTEYDLWGVPDVEEQVLEAEFKDRSDGLWGVYRFKRGFGGDLRRAGGPWDRVFKPGFYALYNWWVRRRDG